MGMPSFWSIDSIYPYEEAPFKEKNALIRLVHVTDYISPGIRKIVVDRELLKSVDKLIDFGRVFDLRRDAIEKFYKPVIFQGRKYHLPHFNEENISFLKDKQNEQLENELKVEIKLHLSHVRRTVNERNFVVDSRVKKTRELDDIKAKIFVFNVGQGDTILLELPNNELWMIDAYFMGQSRFSYECFKKWMKRKYNELSIKRLVLSHFHYDHIKSAHKIIADFRPQEVIIPSTPSTPHSSSMVRNLLREFDYNLFKELSGDEITNFSDLKLTLKRTEDFCGDISLGLDPNNHGIAMIIETDKSFALLPGDIPGQLLYNLNPYFNRAQNKYRFYKVTHHCSHTGSHNDFLSMLNPCDAATSCSHSNSFGHPSNPPKDFIDMLTGLHSGDHRITGFQKDSCLKYFIK